MNVGLPQIWHGKPRILERGQTSHGRLYSPTKQVLVIDPCYLTDYDYPRYMNEVTFTLGGIIFSTAYGDGVYPILSDDTERIIDTNVSGKPIGVDSGTIAVVPFTSVVANLPKYNRNKKHSKVLRFKTENINYRYDGEGRMYLWEG